MDSDRIMLLDKGLIAEFYSPDQLLANTDSIFYGMAKSSKLVHDKEEKHLSK
jgi:ATP-binding cassette, subfamily C (CFTR/MRP), member 1